MTEGNTQDLINEIKNLIDDFKSDDKKQRINSVQNLRTIAQALGKDRTRNELLPYITEMMDDDEDVLVELATQLNRDFLEYIGGPLSAPHLFMPLEKLCEVEEITVREKTIASLKSILAVINIKEMKQQIISLVDRLMGGATFAQKNAAISLFPLIYPHLSQSH